MEEVSVQKMKTIAVYASAHGYGHASRSHEVARALVRKDPDVRVHFTSWVPDSFFAGEAHPRIAGRRRRLDVGMRQIDSLTLDPSGTLEDLDDLADKAEDLIAEEVDFLLDSRVDVVLCDLPHLVFEAAARAGIPAWGLSNFSWDWIYEEYAGDLPGLRRHIQMIRGAYQRARGLFRLPFSGSMDTFTNIVDIPLVARRSEVGKTEARRRLGLDPDKSAILFSFGGFPLNIPAPVGAFRDVVLLCSDPSPDPGPPFLHLSNRRLKELDLRYCDLVAAADAVLSKLGYGIVSECVANRTALIYTPRGRFREYPILAAGVQEYIPATQIMPEDLITGGWLKAFDRLKEQTFPAPIDCHGSEVTAAKLLSELRT